MGSGQAPWQKSQGEAKDPSSFTQGWQAEWECEGPCGALPSLSSSCLPFFWLQDGMCEVQVPPRWKQGLKNRAKCQSEGPHVCAGSHVLQQAGE